MIEMVVLIRKAVFRHESKHVATLPCKHGVPCGYFFFLCSQNNSLNSCLTWRILCMMWTPELFEDQGFGKVIKSSLSGFCLDDDWHFKRILLISVFSPTHTSKSSFPPSSWTRLSWINKIYLRKHSKWFWERQYRGVKDLSQFLFLMACFPSSVNHNTPWSDTHLLCWRKRSTLFGISY